MLSTVLTWIMLALIPVVPAILALVPGLDEPRSSEDDAASLGSDDTRLAGPRGETRRDEPDASLVTATLWR